MNSTGLSIIKTLGCMTAVTFFTIYNTWDHYDYDYHWILGLLTFISTIATPLFFVVAGYLDAQTRHDANWQIGKIKSVVIVFLFWVTVYYVWEPYQRGYLIQPWFIFALIVIYTFHPFIAWLSQRRGLFFAVLLTLLYSASLLFSGVARGWVTISLCAALSAVPILLYNGRPGPHGKALTFFFYAAYPLHLCALLIVRALRIIPPYFLG